MDENSLQTQFKARTASVSLKVEIPPLNPNISHVEDTSGHSLAVDQGREAIYYIVYKELRRDGFVIPKQSLLFKFLLCTPSGHLLLRWETLCRKLQSFMIHSTVPAELSEYINNRCHCAQRLRPQGCSGFLCLILAQLHENQSYSQKTALLLQHTVLACRWALRQKQPPLLDRILTDAARAMDIICSEHDAKCQGSWKCILSLPQPQFSMNYFTYHSGLKRPLPLLLAFGTGVFSTILLYRLLASRAC